MRAELLLSSPKDSVLSSETREKQPPTLGVVALVWHSWGIELMGQTSAKEERHLPDHRYLKKKKL